LSLLWLWELLSLNQVEWESQEFLPIRWVQLFAFSAEILNSRLVSFKTVISLLNSLLEGTWSLWPWGIVSLVNESLDFHWITLGSFQLINVAKSDVFETMDLTKRPEDVVFIFSHSLDLEVLGEVRIDGLSFSKTIKHLSLGKWTRGVNVKVFFNITLGIGGGNSILKETEFRDEIVIVQISIWGQTNSSLWSIILIGKSEE